MQCSRAYLSMFIRKKNIIIIICNNGRVCIPPKWNTHDALEDIPRHLNVSYSGGWEV